MEPRSPSFASTWLLAMLQGQTYDQIAARFRVTKSTVSKSVTDLARDLQSIVGVVGIDEDSAPTAHVIRAHGKDYLEALEHFVPLAKHAATTSLPIITQAHIDQLVLHTARHSRCKQRDIALLLMLIHTGARPNEIARITIADYIDASGQHRSPVWLPAGAATNGVRRPLLLDATVLYWLDAYLAWRVAAGWGVSDRREYRGLQGDSSLFLGRSGESFTSPSAKATAEKGLHDVLQRIFRYANQPGLGVLGARRSVAHRLRADGSTHDEIAFYLGTRTGTVRRLLATSPGKPPHPGASGT
ncbi:site-specific integrase [Janthinobacterium lividum]|nr:site-specific integrase [Janthinobacterium lividum]